MKLNIENDKQNGPGFALLKSTDSQVEPEGLKLRIESRDLKPFLGAGGWQSSDTMITPSAVHKEDVTLVVSIGPDVVRHLREATYKVSLIGTNGATESARVSSKNILMPRASQSGPVAGASAVRSEQTGASGASLDHVTATPTGVSTEAPLVADNTQLPSRSRKNLTSVVISVVALLVVAGGGYFAYSKFSPPPETPEVSNQSAQETPAVVSPEPSSPGPPEVPGPESLTPMEQARKFLAEGPSTSAMINQAKQFWSEGHGEPGFLVMSRAAKAGDPTALIEMARIYDPAVDRPTAPGMPDAKADIAYNYYRQAKKNGSTDADTAISSLRNWAERAAADGNREANVLIRLMTMEQ